MRELAQCRAERHRLQAKNALLWSKAESDAFGALQRQSEGLTKRLRGAGVRVEKDPIDSAKPSCGGYSALVVLLLIAVGYLAVRYFWQRPGPVLVGPVDGGTVRGPVVRLEWTWDAVLWPSEFFEAQYMQEGQLQAEAKHTKQRWLELRDLPYGRYRWTVVVVRTSGSGPAGGPEWERVGPQSAAQGFDYPLP
jgi:hypothetical protein